MKFRNDGAYANPEAAARKLIEIANSIEPSQDGRIFIELINWPFLSDLKGSPAEYKAGLELAIARGWLALHESGSSHRPARSCLPDVLVWTACHPRGLMALLASQKDEGKV
jgi:hypothetical protein